jgi:hypothetical protein
MEKCERRGERHVWGRGEVYTGFWWGKPEKNNQLEDLVMNGSILLKRIFLWDFGHGLDTAGSR